MPGANTDPPAAPEVDPDPLAVHMGVQDNSSTAPPIGGTNAELPSDTAREEAHPSRVESARNPSSAIAETTVGKPMLYTASRLCKEVCSFNMDNNICFLGIEYN